jgi:hypothetical protein
MQVRRWFVAAAGAAAIGLGLVAGTASAQVREDPSELPFYARSVAGTGEWSPVIFYRPVECVPEDFNLSDFFDVPGAFACAPMTVDSFAVWETGPGLDPAGPRQARARGLGAVPIWFVRTEALLGARSDGVETVAELAALDPLMGHASFYTETLHPAGAVKNSLLIVNATGTLEDGRSFKLHISLQETVGHRLVAVTFGD